jgi:hypothetical protein
MIRFYRDMSETRIVTIRELLRFMLNILLEWLKCSNYMFWLFLVQAFSKF